MARKIDDELREMLKEEHSTVVKEADEPSTLMGRWFQETDDDDDEDEGESLEDKITGTKVLSVTTARYLGQTIDKNGNATDIIAKYSFGTIA